MSPLETAFSLSPPPPYLPGWQLMTLPHTSSSCRSNQTRTPMSPCHKLTNLPLRRKTCLYSQQRRPLCLGPASPFFLTFSRTLLLQTAPSLPHYHFLCLFPLVHKTLWCSLRSSHTLQWCFGMSDTFHKKAVQWWSLPLAPQHSPGLPIPLPFTKQLSKGCDGICSLLLCASLSILHILATGFDLYNVTEMTPIGVIVRPHVASSNASVSSHLTTLLEAHHHQQAHGSCRCMPENSS